MDLADRIILEYLKLKEKFPSLHNPRMVDGFWVISGIVDVIDDEGGYWDSYEISIKVSLNYPRVLPELIETGNKIEQSEEWHNSSSCCLSTPAIMFAELYDNHTLLNWFEKFAYPFLANHVFRKKTGHYANEEFDHGIPGMLQGYCKLFKTDDTKEVIERLKLISGIKPFGKNSKCFCGSGRKYKDCYLSKLEKHTYGIPLQVLKRDLNMILGHLRSKRKRIDTLS